MKLNRVESVNQTTFGTRFGKRLTKVLEDNKDTLSGENRRILSNMRNNGLNSVLELEDSSFCDKQTYNYKYVLRLHSEAIDRKNNLKNMGESLYKSFLDYIKSRIGGKTIVADDRFPVPIKDMKDDTDLFVLKAFSDKSNWPEKIEKEVEQADIIVKAFDNFAEDWCEKLYG